MFLSSLKLHNFKGMGVANNEIAFAIPNMTDEGSGLNILVGENNTGKSTVFEAVAFLRDGTNKENIANLKNRKASQSDHIAVEAEFAGNVESVINEIGTKTKRVALSERVYEVEGIQRLRLKRSDEEDIKNLLVYSQKDGDFKNVGGIDASIKNLFDIEFIWADTNPADEVKYGANTLSGLLLKEIAKDCENTPGYKDFKESYNNFFNNRNSALGKRLSDIQTKITDIFETQFSAAKLSFHFDEFTAESFFKNAGIRVSDGVEVPMGQVGQGMQRAITLALLEVYADIKKHQSETGIAKPLFLFIDEPELSLHPKAQHKLLEALLSLSRKQQIFITCHSPIFLKHKDMRKARFHFFEKNDLAFNEIRSFDDFNLFPWSPSWGEIVYKAYKMPTEEFHNELYGHLGFKLGEARTEKVDQYLKKTFPELKLLDRHRTDKKPCEGITLPTFIRHEIHHPEGKDKEGKTKNFYTQEQLVESIELLIQAVKRFETDVAKTNKG